MSNITTYFIGQTEVPDVYLPMANLETSGAGCGLFEYKICGYQGELFHIRDNTLFLKKYPPVGTYRTHVVLEDPLGRFPPISGLYQLAVSRFTCTPIASRYINVKNPY